VGCSGLPHLFQAALCFSGRSALVFPGQLSAVLAQCGVRQTVLRHGCAAMFGYMLLRAVLGYCHAWAAWIETIANFIPQVLNPHPAPVSKIRICLLQLANSWMYLGCSWTVPEPFLGYFWAVPGLQVAFVGCSWASIYSMPSCAVWNSSWGLFLDCSWFVPGLFLGCSWAVPGLPFSPCLTWSGC